MKRLFAIIWIPFVVELLNVVVHYLLRDNSEGVNWIDGVSTVVTAAVVFFVGWTVARRLRRLEPAVLAALFIWISSTLLVIALISIKSAKQVDLLVIKGFVFSALLSIPIVVVISTIGAIAGKRAQPSGS
jgi:hypothetical protein